jgi:hypothetical protein
MTNIIHTETIDLRAMDECICGHNRVSHAERSGICTSCGCKHFSKTTNNSNGIAKEYQARFAAD